MLVVAVHAYEDVYVCSVGGVVVQNLLLRAARCFKGECSVAGVFIRFLSVRYKL